LPSRGEPRCLSQEKKYSHGLVVPHKKTPGRGGRFLWGGNTEGAGYLVESGGRFFVRKSGGGWGPVREPWIPGAFLRPFRSWPRWDLGWGGAVRTGTPWNGTPEFPGVVPVVPTEGKNEQKAVGLPDQASPGGIAPPDWIRRGGMLLPFPARSDTEGRGLEEMGFPLLP